MTTITTPPKQPKQRRTFPRICAHCGKEFQAESDRARWCSDACKMRAYRERREKKTA